MAFIPQTAKERVDFVATKLISAVTKGKRDGMDEENLQYWQTLIDILSGASDDLEKYEAYKQHSIATTRLNVFQSKQIDELEAKNKLLELQIKNELGTIPITNYQDLKHDIDHITSTNANMSRKLIELTDLLKGEDSLQGIVLKILKKYDPERYGDNTETTDSTKQG